MGCNILLWSDGGGNAHWSCFKPLLKCIVDAGIKRNVDLRHFCMAFLLNLEVMSIFYNVYITTRLQTGETCKHAYSVTGWPVYFTGQWNNRFTWWMRSGWCSCVCKKTCRSLWQNSPEHWKHSPEAPMGQWVCGFTVKPTLDLKTLTFKIHKSTCSKV